MASPGLVLLLLMSSFLLVSTGNSSPNANENQQQEISTEELNKVKEGFKKTGKIILQNIDNIRTAVSPFLSLIPIYGPLISAIFSLTGIGVSVINQNVNNKPLLESIKFEFENLNDKLDKYHTEQKWEIWASSTFFEPEKKIEGAWILYKNLVQNLLLAKDDIEIQKHKDVFLEAYKNYEPATRELENMLSHKGISFSESLENLLPKHVKCHEKMIREYTVFISDLIRRGNTLNIFYYKLKHDLHSTGISEATLAYKAGSVMFNIHKNCVINAMDYIKSDVKELIDPSKNRDNLAKEVRLFLEEAYDRYDWMVVAFQTKKSSHEIIETLNRHAFSGFTEVTKGGVSVAVARQAKGTHTMGTKVKEAIDKCISESVVCYKVAEELSKCNAAVEGIPVTKTYTAVHAYLRKAHDSHSAQEAPPEEYEVSADPENDTPYISTGKCSKSKGVKGGKFVVLIKSDEEIKTQDPCSTLSCGSGECLRVENTFRAICQCKEPNYGQHCEETLLEYTREMQEQGGPLVVDSRRRTNPRR